MVAAQSPQAMETGAILQTRNLNTAETNYYAQYGKYATALVQLGPPAKGAQSSESAADLIPADLATGVKNGYRFTLAGSSNGYTIHADPLEYGKTGGRSFFSDESPVIRQNKGNAPATAASPEMD